MKKICLNCGEEHTNSRSDYCNKVIVKTCHCGKEFEVKCTKRINKNCSRECSYNSRNNNCLNCGGPCKEKYCGRDIEITCVGCGNKKTTQCSGDMPIYCSSSCAMADPEIKAKIKKSQFDKHGSYSFNTDKQKETMIERYGYETPAKNEEVKKKARETQLRNNNGVHAFNTDKQRETMMDKYGSPGRLGDPEELKKQQVIMMERYGVKTPTEHPEFLQKSMDTLIERYGQIFNNSQVSKINMAYAEKLREELGVEVELEHYIKNGQIFLDLYLPEYKIAIEINPTVTHNSTRSFICLRMRCKDIPCSIHKPTEQNYHYNRAKIAQEEGIRLIQVYDWEDQDAVFNLIANKVKPIYNKYSARKLDVKKITQREANLFLKVAHIQGAAKNNCIAMDYLIKMK